TVSGLVNPVGSPTVTFRLFAPTDPTCSGAPVFTSTVALSNGTATSGAFTPVDVGAYRWVATYDGDTNNAPVSGTCGDPTETRAVEQETHAVATVASPNTALCVGGLSDQAIVSGLVNPVGSPT